MSVGEQIARVVGAATTLLLVAILAYIVWLLRSSLAATLSRISGFEGWGVKFALTGGQQGMAGAFEMAAKNPKWTDGATRKERDDALARAGRNRALLEGAEILWVDDRPSNNRNEARMLRSFGCLITFAATTEEALSALKDGETQHRPFQLILSDISRDLPAPDPTAGLTMLATMRAGGITQPIILYVGIAKPGAGTPPDAFGITDRPDQLLNLTVEALGRMRGG